MEKQSPVLPSLSDPKKDADYVFYELTRSICPECRRVIDAQVSCPRQQGLHAQALPGSAGRSKALVYGDAEAYIAIRPSSTSRARSRWPSARK